MFLRLEAVTKRMGTWALAEVSFQVTGGKIHGLVGEAGVGKSALLKMIAGLVYPEAGAIVISQNPQTADQEKPALTQMLVGYLPQVFSFQERLSTLDLLVMLGRKTGISYREALENADAVLTRLDLQAFAEKMPIDFNATLQRKILLAQALLGEPRLLLLDELLTNMERTARKSLAESVRQYARETGATVVISASDLREIEGLIDEVTFLKRSTSLDTSSRSSAIGSTAKDPLLSVTSVAWSGALAAWERSRQGEDRWYLLHTSNDQRLVSVLRLLGYLKAVEVVEKPQIMIRLLTDDLLRLRRDLEDVLVKLDFDLIFFQEASLSEEGPTLRLDRRDL